MFNRDLEFYSLETNGIDFCKVLEEINNKPNKDSRGGGKILKIGTGEMNLTEFVENKEYCDGLVARSEKEDLPLIGNLFTKLFSFLGLKKDEGLIDMTYFCYIKDLKIICLLPARKGVKWGTFKHYIQSVHKIKSNFDIFPLLTKKALEKYNNMGSITFVDTVLYIGNNSQPLSKKIQDTPLGALIKEANMAEATRIKLEIFNEKREGGLKVKATKNFVGLLRKIGLLYEAKSIKIKGSPSPTESDEVIDLIKERYKLKINLGDRSRYLDFGECCKKVHGIIENNLEDISELVE